MEDILLKNYNYPGFVMTENDTAFKHFMTGDVGQEIIDGNRVALCSRDALLVLKIKFNLTSSQTLKCIANQRITAAKICTPKVIQCDPSRKR